MLIRDGDYQGIKLLAADRSVIMDEVWGDEDDGEWTEYQQIEEGLQIIGIKAVTFDESRITGLSLLLRPLS